MCSVASDPRLISCLFASVKIQVRPACFVLVIQDAYVKIRVVPLGGVDCLGSSAMDLGLGVGELICANVHSLADAMSLVIVSVGESVMFSKIRLFLEVHIVHAIQGKRLVATPIGGRLMRSRDVWSSCPKDVSAVIVRGEVQGERFHTCLAKSQ